MFQHDGSPLQYQSSVRNVLDARFSRGRFDYPSWSPDLTPLDFYPFEDLKNTVCVRKEEHCRTRDTKLKLAVLPFH